MSLKSRIDHLVKFNPVANRIFVSTLSLGVRMLSLGKPIKKDLVLFTSDIGKSYSGSPRAIYEEMVANGIASQYDIVWAFNEPEKYQDIGSRIVKHDSLAYFSIARQAKYWITDVNIERGLKFKRKETQYLNTWHGSSIKTLGRDIHGRIYYDCSSIDWMCVNSEYDVRTFSRAFGMADRRFIRTGLPKNDYLWAHKGDDSTIYKKKLGLPEDKKVLLYAPTWRDSQDGGKTYSIAPPINLEKWKSKLGESCVLVFRMHPLTQQAMGFEKSDFLYDYSSYNPLNDLLLASDLLITDYSSLAFDYSILERPVLCFGYDSETYSRIRGLYIDPIELFPSGVQRNEDELLDCLASASSWASDGSRSVSADYNLYGGNATAECMSILFNATEKQ